MKVLSFLLITLLYLSACTSDTTSDKNSTQTSPTAGKTRQKNEKGIGEVKNVKLSNPLEEHMVSKGKAIYEMKCAACHKLNDKRVVGPGWLGLTKKRTPEWIMNMITNVDIMLEQDEDAYELLKECLVRMPNQNISVGDARDILEFMRQIDGEK